MCLHFFRMETNFWNLALMSDFGRARWWRMKTCSQTVDAKGDSKNQKASTEPVQSTAEPSATRVPSSTTEHSSTIGGGFCKSHLHHTSQKYVFAHFSIVGGAMQIILFWHGPSILQEWLSHQMCLVLENHLLQTVYICYQCKKTMTYGGSLESSGTVYSNRL